MPPDEADVESKVYDNKDSKLKVGKCVESCLKIT